MRAWLFAEGQVVRGPVPISAGGPGSETPVGRFTVLWKEKLHISVECRSTPMPNSVFFTTGGVAFHAGNMERPSAGCIKLTEEDAVAWYSGLEIGDEIWIRGSDSPAERACRIGLTLRRSRFKASLVCGLGAVLRTARSIHLGRIRPR